MIETQSFSISYTADGAQTEWAFPYPYISSDDIKLYVVVDGVKMLVDPTYYSFDTTTNLVTYPLAGDPVVSGTVLYLERQTTLTQLEDSSLGNFKSNDVERMADKLTMIAQEVAKPAGESYIDDSLSLTSENAVQNKVITAQINYIKTSKQDALPSGTAGQYLQKTSEGLQWAGVDALPSQTSQSGKFLTTNGTTASWDNIPTELPSQQGNNGKFLTTNGSSASWATVSAGADTSLSNLTDAGKIQAAHLAMPSNVYDELTVPASGTILTAPADGVYFLAGRSTGAGLQYIFLGTGTNSLDSARKAQWQLPYQSDVDEEIEFPVYEGQEICIEYAGFTFTGLPYSAAGLKFFYAVGAESKYVPPAE